MSRSRTTRRTARALPGVVLLVALAGAGLGGCASDQGTSSDPATPTPTESSSTTQTTTSDYLPTPVGVELTAPGTELDLKDEATVAWRPRQDVVGVLDVSVAKIEETEVDDVLEGFRLPRSLQDSTPFFVRAVVANRGDTDLGGRQVPLYAVDSSGRLVEATGVDNAFGPCPDGVLPAIFAPGDRARTCLIFFVLPGAALESVLFRPPEGVVPLTWTGSTDTYGEKKPKQGRQPNDGQDGQDG